MVEQVRTNYSAEIQNAIANAVMTAQLSMLAPIPGRVPEGERVADFLERKLQERSKGQCRTGSLVVIDHLATYYPHIFTHIFLLTADKNEAHPFKEYPKDQFTSYAIARDVYGFWHSVSPANHKATQDESAFTTINAPTQDLQEMLLLIQQEEGGIWPTAETIQNALFANDASYCHPKRIDMESDLAGPADFIQEVFHIHQVSSDQTTAELELFVTRNALMRTDLRIGALQLEFEIYRMLLHFK